MRILAVIVLLVFCATAQERTSIAVLELEGNGVSESDLGGLSNRLRTELFKTGTFRVIERSRMDEILTEQGFQQTGCTNTQCAVQIGQIIEVQKVIMGSVDKVGEIYTADIRMVDVATGEIVQVASQDCARCSVGEVMLKSIPAAVAKLTRGQAGEGSAPGGAAKGGRRGGRGRPVAFALAIGYSGNFANARSWSNDASLFDGRHPRFFKTHGGMLEAGVARKRMYWAINGDMTFSGRGDRVGGARLLWTVDILKTRHVSAGAGVWAGMSTVTLECIYKDDGEKETAELMKYLGPEARIRLNAGPVGIFVRYALQIGQTRRSYTDVFTADMGPLSTVNAGVALRL